MNKKLRNILTLSLALLSTVSFAQEISLDSRTRANMHGDNEMMLVEQRATLSTNIGGDDWGVHLSSDVNWFHHDANTGAGTLTARVYEAYASTNLFDLASLTVGRQAWDFGSGALIGSNQWSDVRNTRDGMLLDIDNDLVDLNVGYSNFNNGNPGEESMTYTLVNASKTVGDFTANILLINQMNDGVETNATGLDLGYTAMDGALEINAMMNALTQGDAEMDMVSLGATYSVNDDLSVRASQSVYGDQGFAIDGGTNMGFSDGGSNNSWFTHGNLGYLQSNDEQLSIGVDYSMGDFDLSATVHTITNDTYINFNEDATVTEISIGYTLNDHASLNLKMVEDDRFNLDGDSYTWLTLNVTP